jgi:hypothetical protein
MRVIKITIFSVMLLFAVSLHAQEKKEIEFSRYSDKIALSNANSLIADSVFNFISEELDFIDYDDCENCRARAHVTAALIEKKFPGITVGKVWLFGDSKRATQSEKYRNRQDSYLYLEDKCSSWGYHVAPVIIFEHGSVKDTIVIDPSTQDGPVSFGNWAVKLIHPGSKGFLVFKEKRYYTFPMDKAKRFQDHKELWTDDENKALEDEDYSRSIKNLLGSVYGSLDDDVTRQRVEEIQKQLQITN